VEIAEDRAALAVEPTELVEPPHRGRAKAVELPDTLVRWIVDAMPEGVVYSDRDGIIRLWNRGAERIFGHREADVLGRTLDVIVPERWRARHWDGYRTVMQTGVTRYGAELLRVPASRSDGTRISIEFSIMLHTDADGRVLGAAAIIRDVTARWEQEQQLRQRLAAREAAEPRAEHPSDRANET
jgi:PAS domain S-box-containing protein